MNQYELSKILDIIEEYQKQCVSKALYDMQRISWVGFATTVIVYDLYFYFTYFEQIWISIGFGILGSMITSILIKYTHPEDQTLPSECVERIIKYNIKNTTGLEKLNDIISNNKKITLKELVEFGLGEIKCRLPTKN